MAANSRGTIRPNGRSPPFLAIGLTVALVILGFNYWSLSARNGEQSNEIAVLESEMRLMNAKKISAEKRSEAISDKVKELEDELSKQKAVIADKMAQLVNLNAERDSILTEKQKFETDSQNCNQEQLPTCSKEKEDLKMELSSLKEAYENEKNNPKETICDESKCADISKATRQKLLDDLKRVVGAGSLYSLYQNNVNIGSYEAEIQQLVAQGQNQPIVGGGQNNFLQQQQQLQQQLQQQQQQQQGIPQQPQQPQLPDQQPQAAVPAGDDRQQQTAQDTQPNAAELDQKLADQQAPGAQPPQDPQQLGQGEKDTNADQALPQVPNPMDGLTGDKADEDRMEVDDKDNIDALDNDVPDNDQAKNLTKPSGTINSTAMASDSKNSTQTKISSTARDQADAKMTTVTTEPPISLNVTQKPHADMTKGSNTNSPASKHLANDDDYEDEDEDNADDDYDEDEEDQALKVLPNDKDDVNINDYADDDDDDKDYTDWLKANDDELDDIANQDKNIDEMQARLERDAQQ